MKNEIMFIAQFIPLIFFYIFLAFPTETFQISLLPLGRLISILLILFYTSIDVKYGIAICILVIFYYRMEFLEKCCEMNSSMLTCLSIEPFTEERNANLINFREEYCKNNQLEFKGEKVKNENAPHIFPELEFLNKPCNPCDKTCGLSIETRIDAEEELVYPKMTDQWVYKIWNTWFSSDNSPPYAYDSKNYSKQIF